VHFVRSFRKETGDVRLVEKALNIPGEEENPGISEK